MSVMRPWLLAWVTGGWALVPSPEVGRKLFPHEEFACCQKLMRGQIPTSVLGRKKNCLCYPGCGAAGKFPFLKVTSH